MLNDNPPESLPEFLEWLRFRTEEAWSRLPEPKIDDFKAAGSAYRPRTRWLPGLTDAEIDAVEKQWGLHFPSDYRLFLHLLNAPDRLMFTVSYHGSTLPNYEGEKTVAGEVPAFFNWLTDYGAIHAALSWPVEGLVFDVFHNNLWFEDWGPRPKNENEATLRLNALVKDVPRLVPVSGHSYLVDAGTPRGYVVLSVHQSDITVDATDLRSMLIYSFWKLLGLTADIDQYNSILDGIRSTISSVDGGSLVIDPGLIAYITSMPPPTKMPDSVYKAALKIPFWGRFLELRTSGNVWMNRKVTS